MDFIKSKHIFLEQKLNSIEEVLNFISTKAVEQELATEIRPLYETFVSREKEGSTGMMNGFAIPHAKSKVIKRASLMVVKLENGIEWESMDGNPIEFVVALLVPEEEAGTTHLRMLSSIARLLMKKEAVDFIKSAKQAEEIADYLNNSLS